MHGIGHHLGPVQVILLRISVQIAVPSDVSADVLSQDRQHYPDRLPLLLFWSLDRLFQDVVHLSLEDWVKLVDRQERTAFVVVCVGCQVLVDVLLVDASDFGLFNNLRPDDSFLHEFGVER